MEPRAGGAPKPSPTGLLAGLLCAAGLLTGMSSSEATSAAPGAYRDPVPGFVYEFPRDHGSHDAFRTEWWYYTGHVTAANGRRFGYQLTFFRQGVDRKPVSGPVSRWAIRDLYLAHFALSDLDESRFRYAEKISRAGLGKAGAEPGRLLVWIDRWKAEADGTDPHRHHLTAQAKDFSIDLIVAARKPPVTHGRDGISRKGPAPNQASHYYSLTSLETTGRLVIRGEPLQVTGQSWMDHEFGSADLGPDLAGWDWFSLQLEGATEMMAYRLRRADGGVDPASSGTLVLPDGRTQALSAGDLAITVLDHWTSPESGARYPSRWRLAVPSAELDLEIIPELPQQELMTGRSTQVTYWEGAARVTGRHGGRLARGQAYVELTGYARPFTTGAAKR